MRAELRRSIFLACVGLLGGFALVVSLYGVSTLFKHGFGSSAIRSLTDPAGETRQGNAAADQTKEEARTMPGKPVADAPAPERRNPAAGATTDPRQAQSPAPPQVPTFDIIRVEPSGETVIAGRAAPNTTVELLRDNQPIARALVDPSGQFAIVPPALPTGNSEITLRGTGPDGQGRPSRESVVVVVAPGRNTKPLIALTAPDKPTVVLSQPDPAGPKVAASEPRKSPVPDARQAQAKDAAKSPAAPATKAETARPEPAAGPGPVKIVSVEAEEGGKLYVTSQASPGATVRLYLNDTLVAPGSAGPDGRVAFTIGRGIRPGEYKVRVDQVDPVTGKVKTRSEVAFTVPGAAPGKAVAAKTPTPPASQALASLRSDEPAPAARSHAPSAATGASQVGPSQAGPSKADPSQAGSSTRDPARSDAAKADVTKADATKAVVPAPTNAQAGAEPPRTVFVPEINTARISRGDNLWQISRRIYGKGTRYTVIFDANQPQIRNPDLIYPGQIFVLPADGTAAVPQDEKRG